MTVQTPETGSVKGEISGQTSWIQRLAWFVVFLICGAATFIFGSNYFAIFPTNKNLTYNLLLSAVFLAAALYFRRTGRWKPYWLIAFAFFVGSVVFPISSLLASASQTVLGWFHLTNATSQGVATAKVVEVIVMVVPILVLTRLSGADFGSIYLKRGNLKWGLCVGGLVWFNFASSAFLFFAERFTSIHTLAAALGWGLVFSFANGFMEELWLRGLFLKRFEPVLGAGGSILLTSIIFAAMHGGATYLTPVAIPFIVANTFTLGLACGTLMMKTGSIWGAVLIHAAADLFLFIAMLSNA